MSRDKTFESPTPVRIRIGPLYDAGYEQGHRDAIAVFRRAVEALPWVGRGTLNGVAQEHVRRDQVLAILSGATPEPREPG